MNVTLITLALKIVLISGFCSLITWVAVYTRMAAWWRNPVGRTLVTKTLLIAAMFVPSILGLFFHLSLADSYLVGWVDVGLIGAVTPVMCWRTIVWIKLGRVGQLPHNGQPPSNEQSASKIPCSEPDG